MPSDISAKDALTWEFEPSTRSSVHLYTKSIPVDVTLTTAGTAQDIIRINTTSGTGDALPAVNIATNPSFETANPPTGYTASGAILARVDTTVVAPRTGSFSMRVTPNNAAVGEGAFWASEVLGSTEDRNYRQYLTISAYFRGTAGDARIEVRDTTGAIPALAVGATITLDGTWRRSVAQIPLTMIGTQYRVYFVTVTQHPNVFFIDSFQAEIQTTGNATAYLDGDQGLFNEWDGTAHASMSRRRYGLVAIRGFNLYCTRDVYVAYDYVASATTGERKRAGTDWWADNLHLVRRISFINVIAGETPTIFGRIDGVHNTKHIT